MFPNNHCALFQVRAKTGTKDLITIMIKDMEITIVPMVVIKTIGYYKAMGYYKAKYSLDV